MPKDTTEDLEDSGPTFRNMANDSANSFSLSKLFKVTDVDESKRKTMSASTSSACCSGRYKKTKKKTFLQFPLCQNHK